MAESAGITAAQIARLLPTLPSSGSRDGKIPKFNGDDLEWQGDEPVEWYISISPNYIVQPGFAGTYTIFIHDLATDEAGSADVTNIVVRPQGLVMLSQAWTAASGARTIQFTISTANSQNLAGNHASRNHLDFEIDFRDASNTVVTDRHLAIDVLASTPAVDAGLTAEQEALLLPTFPATGSRDNKVPKFSGDTLGWEEDESGGTSSGGFEQRYELVEIPTSCLLYTSPSPRDS